jgi:pimeloyl-ACP methyl ester carboxylesterase
MRDNAVIAVVTMPADVGAWTELAFGDKEGGLSNVLLAYNDVRRTVAIDFDRVYVAGWGEGVRVATVLGSRFPDRFAGVIGRSGDPPEDAVVENFRNLPTFFAGAGKGATTFKEKADSFKYDNVTIKPDGKETDIWAWIKDHPRISNPAEVVLAPGGQIGNRAYWVQVQAFDKTGVAYIKAAIDRGTNTIRSHVRHHPVQRPAPRPREGSQGRLQRRDARREGATQPGADAGHDPQLGERSRTALRRIARVRLAAQAEAEGHEGRAEVSSRVRRGPPR